MRAISPSTARRGVPARAHRWDRLHYRIKECIVYLLARNSVIPESWFRNAITDFDL